MEEKDRNKDKVQNNGKVSISPELQSIVGNNLFSNSEEMEEGINRIMGIEQK